MPRNTEGVNYTVEELQETLNHREHKALLLHDFMRDHGESHAAVVIALHEMKNDESLTAHNCVRCFELEMTEFKDPETGEETLDHDKGSTRYQVRDVFQEHTKGMDDDDRRALAEAVAERLVHPYFNTVEQLPEGMTKLYLSMKGREEIKSEADMLCGNDPPATHDAKQRPRDGIRASVSGLEETARRMQEGHSPNTFESTLEDFNPQLKRGLEEALATGREFPRMGPEETASAAHALHETMKAMWDVRESQWGPYYCEDMATITSRTIFKDARDQVSGAAEQNFVDAGTTKEEAAEILDKAIDNLTWSIERAPWIPDGRKEIEKSLNEAHRTSEALSLISNGIRHTEGEAA